MLSKWLTAQIIPGPLIGLEITENIFDIIEENKAYKEKIDNFNKELLHVELLGHNKGIKDIKFSPNGKLLASADRNKTLIIWDIETGEELFRKNTPEKIQSIVFEPCGRYIFCGFKESINIYNTQSGELINSFEFDYPLSVMATLPDCQHFALVTEKDKAPLIKIYNFLTKDVVNEFKPISKYIFEIEYSKNGKYFVCTGNHQTIDIYNSKNGNIITSLNETKKTKIYTHWINKLAVSPDNIHIAYATGKTNKEQLIIWNINTGKEELVIEDFSSNISSLVYSPNGEFIIAGQFSGAFQFNVLNTRTGENLTKFFGGRMKKCPGGEVRLSVDWSPNGKYLASGCSCCQNDIIRIWDISTGKEHPTQKSDYSFLNNIFSSAFEMNLSAEFLEKFIKYEGDIVQDVKNAGQIEPKDEFETTAEYNVRARDHNLKGVNIIIKYWNKYNNVEQGNNIKTRIDSIGKFNADKNEFIFHSINAIGKMSIAREEAKDFKYTWWKNAIINSEIYFIEDNPIPHIQNIQVINPSNNKVYKAYIDQQPLHEIIQFYDKMTIPNQ